MSDTPRPHTILVVDDDPDHVALVAGILRRHGYAVLTADRADEALRLATERAPDAAVLDVMMDHLGEGFDLARSLRQQHPGSDLPVVFLTGMDAVFDLRSEIGEDWIPGDRVLTKPVSAGALLGALAELLRDATTGGNP